MSKTTLGITVEFQPNDSAYLANVPVDEDFEKLRDTVRRLIEEDKLRTAGYDIGTGGGLAFKLGSIGDQPPVNEVDNAADLCDYLAEFLEEAAAESQS